MDPGFGSVAPHLAAMVGGGLASSIGMAWWVRSARGRSVLLRAKGWHAALVSLAFLAAGAAAAWYLARPFLDLASGGGAGSVEAALPSPGALLVVGALFGLPLSLPALWMGWRTAHADDRRRRIRARATKDERRAYAADLLRQLQDATDADRIRGVSVTGDGGTVLAIDGKLSAKEGERLTAALRRDLKEFGFKRVEGTGTRKEWWTRV